MPIRQELNLFEDEALMLNYATLNCMKSFTILFERHNRNMIGFVIHQSCCTEDIAQDIVASTWEKVIKSKAHYQPIAKFKTYLYTILCNTQVDFYRRINRFDLTTIDEADKLQINSQDNKFALEVLKDQTCLKIAYAIKTLPEEQSIVVTLYYLEGFKIKEIAIITDVTVECAKSRLRYAKKGLKKYFLKNDINITIVTSYLDQLELA